MAKIEFVNNWRDPQTNEVGRTVWRNEKDAKINADSLKNKYGYEVTTSSRPRVAYMLPDGRMSDELY